jgi:spermidine synthase
VRRDGALELRVRGTFASYYKPGSALTGSVWDALAAPLLALGRARRAPSVLLLGLGAGSAARVARALAPGARIVGVEIDPAVVALARRHFELDRLGVEVVQADAAVFLARSRERFDAVLDDVFVGRGRAVRKPAWLLEGGLAAAASRVAPGGLLASNALDEAADVARQLAARFRRVLAIDVAGYDNRVLVGGPPRLSARALRAAVARSPVLSPTLRNLSFRTLG